jgi:hypothetical protein
LLSYDPKNRIFIMSGASIPTNTREFYEPIIKWVEGYILSDFAKGGITINVSLDYFSIQSSVILLRILREFDKIKDKVVVNWMHEVDDADMKEIGDDLKMMLGLEFNIIENRNDTGV